MGQEFGLDGQAGVFPLSDRMRTREGMAIARAKGKLRGKQPKLTDRQRRELCRMHPTAELFSVSRLTVYRTLDRSISP